MSVQWNANGNWLLTGSRDHLIKLFDIRTMKEMCTLKSHKKEVNGANNHRRNWRFIYSHTLVLVTLYVCNYIPTCVGVVLAWHPVHETLFASGGSDGAILFWEVGYVNV